MNIHINKEINMRHKLRKDELLRIVKPHRLKLVLLLLLAGGGLFLSQFTPLFPNNATNADPINLADGANFTMNPADDIPACANESECFAFSVNTKLTYSGALTGTNTAFAIPTNGSVGDSVPDYDWIIDWGDGTSITISGISSETQLIYGINHSYLTGGGQYQITIRPNGPATSGWFDAFGFTPEYSWGVNDMSNRAKFLSIDTPFTNLMRSQGASYRFANIFYGASNGLGIPTGLFDNVVTTGDTSLSKMFSGTFSGFASNSSVIMVPDNLLAFLDTSQVTDFSYMLEDTFSGYDIPDGIFDDIDTSKGTNFEGMFKETFADCAVIPAGIFDFLDTGQGTNFSYMFSRTFEFCYDAPTIPSGLFGHLDTSQGTDFSYMFESTFSDAAGDDSLSATIPADLFDLLDTSQGTNFESMFGGTFGSYAYGSELATIPAGLFDSLDTSQGTDFNNMFSDTFSSFAQSSLIANIPAGLFDSLDTSQGINFSEMFSSTFYDYASISTVTNIPAGLFNFDASKGEVFDEMFFYTFGNCARESAVGTIPAGLFNIDASNGEDFSGMFHATFWNYAQNSTVGTIPAGVFDLDTSKGTNFENMFYATFNSYAEESTVGTIPAGLFDSVNTSQGEYLEMFSSTFERYATNSTVGTIPPDLFAFINNSQMDDWYYDFFDTFDRYAVREAKFVDNGSEIPSLTQSFSDPYQTKAGISGTPNYATAIQPGDTVYPSYRYDDYEDGSFTSFATIEAPEEYEDEYADYDWYRTDGTSCSVSNPTKDCGPQTTSVSFPVVDEWTPDTPTDKGNVTFYAFNEKPLVVETNYRFYKNNGSTTPDTALAADNTPASVGQPDMVGQDFRLRTGIKNQLAQAIDASGAVQRLTAAAGTFGLPTSSPDGERLAVSDAVSIYMSTDDGVTWGVSGSTPNGAECNVLSISSDGQLIACNDSGGGYRVSYDGGDSWQPDPFVGTYTDTLFMVVSNEGSNIVGVYHDGMGHVITARYDVSSQSITQINSADFTSGVFPYMFGAMSDDGWSIIGTRLDFSQGVFAGLALSFVVQGGGAVWSTVDVNGTDETILPLRVSGVGSSIDVLVCDDDTCMSPSYLTSTDGGQTWTDQTPTTIPSDKVLTWISADGNDVLLYNQGGTEIYGTGQSGYTLQFAPKATTCSAVSSWEDVTANSAIAYKTNSSIASSSLITSSPAPAAPSGSTWVAQKYVSDPADFTVADAIPSGSSGLWDFSLTNQSAAPNTPYCFRIVNSDGTELNIYDQYPEIITGEDAYIELTVSNPNPSMSIIPTSAGAIGTTSHTLFVKTNYAAGYDLSVRTTATSGRLSKADGSAFLNPIGGSLTAPLNLANNVNTWGFTITNPATAVGSCAANCFAPVPTSNTVIKSRTSAHTGTDTNPSEPDGDPTSVWYGANADLTKPSGVYKATIVFTAVAGV
jgi:hypothetical protein